MVKLKKENIFNNLINHKVNSQSQPMEQSQMSYQPNMIEQKNHRIKLKKNLLQIQMKKY